MTRLKLLLLAIVLAAAALSTASAQHPSALTEGARGVLGPWEFSNADRDRRCSVTLRGEAASVGLKLEIDKGCPGVFPFMKDVVGWSLAENDFLRLLDAKGKSVLEFSQVEDGMYEAPRPGEGVLFLQTAASVQAPAASADEMTGDWALLRGANNRMLCVLTLSNAPRDDGFALRLKPGCDAAVTRFAPLSWDMDQGELVLRNAREQVWRFEALEAKRWQRSVPETADPLVLIRP
jgi:hypothetical protein